MASFILSFDGKGRDHLLEVLRGIHSLEVSDFKEEERDCYNFDLTQVLRFVNLPSHDDTAKSLDISGDVPKKTHFLFCNSLRAEKFQIVGLEQLEEGHFTSEICEEPLPVMLFRFHSLDRFGLIQCDLTNYGTLLLRKCIQMKEEMVSGVHDSRSFLEGTARGDDGAGPSQPKVRRMDSTSQHHRNKTVLSPNQHASVTLHLLEKIYPDSTDYHSTDISVMIEAILCLEVMQRKLTLYLGHINCLFDERWDVLTSVIEESIRNKRFVELYSSVFLKHWNVSDIFYSNRNRGLLTLLTTTEDLPIGWRVQLCGNVVCSTLQAKPYSSDADVDDIVQKTALVANVLIQDCHGGSCETVTKNWKILSETFDMHHLSIIFNTICLALTPPLTNDVIDAVVSYLSAACHHDLECIDVLKTIQKGPRRKRALESVYVNADYFSCQALFHVARTAEEINSGLPAANILSELGHKLLQKAFERYCDPTNADILQGRLLLSSRPVLEVLNWFFCRISEMGSKERAAGDQFRTFMHSIGKIFKFDKDTQLSFLSHMQNSPALLSVIREAVSAGGGDIYINPCWYNWFNTT